jgi:probable HAF family extracellular repeat protein
MKSNILMGTTALVLLAGLAAPLGLAAQNEREHPTKQIHYSVRALGTLGGTVGEANGINNGGWVTGISNLSGDQNSHAFLWREGVMSDLGTLGGLDSFVGWPPNERGEIVGNAETADSDPLGEDFCGYGTGLLCRGFLWQDGVMTPLPTLGGNNGEATQINNRGQAVGWAENSTQDPNCLPPQVLDFEAVIWGPEKGRIRELAPFPGDSIAAATAINDDGQVVGGSGICSSPSPAVAVHAVLWQNRTMIDLGSLGGKISNIAFAINNRGQIAGISDLPGDTTQHAFFWQNGVMTDLGTLPGDFSSVAFGIGSKGQVAGESCDASGNCRAFVWQEGVMTDLNTVSSPRSLYLVQADWINSRGEIVGAALDKHTGATVPFLATPCDEKHADY